MRSQIGKEIHNHDTNMKYFWKQHVCVVCILHIVKGFDIIG